MIVDFIFIKFKILSISLPPPPLFHVLLDMICYLVSKYLRIFQIFFCYCRLIIFIVDKEHTLYDLNTSEFWEFVSWPRIWFILVNVLCRFLSILLDAPWIMRCSPLAVRNRKYSYLMQPPASFPLFSAGGSFPSTRYFPYICAVILTQLKSQGQRSPALSLWSSFFPVFPLWSIAALPFPDLQLPFFTLQDHPTLSCLPFLV